jgi:hypothetical protein
MWNDLLPRLCDLPRKYHCDSDVIRAHIDGLFNDAVGSSGYVVWNFRMKSEYWIETNRINYDLIWLTI